MVEYGLHKWTMVKLLPKIRYFKKVLVDICQIIKGLFNGYFDRILYVAMG